MAKNNKKSGPVQKQKANVYTMMLIFSFLALLLASVLMYLESGRYDHDIKAKEYKKSSMRPTVSQLWRGMA